MQAYLKHSTFTTSAADYCVLQQRTYHADLVWVCFGCCAFAGCKGVAKKFTFTRAAARKDWTEFMPYCYGKMPTSKDRKKAIELCQPVSECTIPNVLTASMHAQTYSHRHSHMRQTQTDQLRMHISRYVQMKVHVLWTGRPILSV